MTRAIVTGILLALLGMTPAHADDESSSNPTITKILVTFADPGMSNATRAGHGGPGYRRRSSGYLASVGVKRKANRIAKDFKLETLDEWPIISLKVHCLVFGVAQDIQVEDLLLRLRKRPEVDSAQLLNEFQVTGSTVHNDDPYANLQHNLYTLELVQAHNWSLGNGTNVTIIDTGADLEHPELKLQIASHRNFVDGNRGNFSADAHGTAVAGVIAAAANNGVGVIGVAPLAQLSVLKACWYRHGTNVAICNSFTLAKALSYAIDSDTDIINLSLGGPSDELLDRLLRQAIERGIVVVAAAPSVLDAGFPAEVSGVIVVGSSDQTGSRSDNRPAAINAPGADILVPAPNGGYDFASGSSLSAAHVSGIIALLMARQPSLTYGRINTLLVASRSAVYESVNACRALAALLHESGCRVPEAISQLD